MPAETAVPQSTGVAGTAWQQQALQSARDYLSLKSFSRNGLISQLSSEYGEGFGLVEATLADDHVHVDWNEQVYGPAKIGRAHV